MYTETCYPEIPPSWNYAIFQAKFQNVLHNIPTVTVSFITLHDITEHKIELKQNVSIPDAKANTQIC